MLKNILFFICLTASTVFSVYRYRKERKETEGYEWRDTDRYWLGKHIAGIVIVAGMLYYIVTRFDFTEASSFLYLAFAVFLQVNLFFECFFSSKRYIYFDKKTVRMNGKETLWSQLKGYQEPFGSMKCRVYLKNGENIVLTKQQFLTLQTLLKERRMRLVKM